MNNTRYRIAFVSRLAISALKRSAVLTGVSLCVVCGVLADDIRAKFQLHQRLAENQKYAHL
jgi:hypothetical protein